MHKQRYYANNNRFKTKVNMLMQDIKGNHV